MPLQTHKFCFLARGAYCLQHRYVWMNHGTHIWMISWYRGTHVSTLLFFLVFWRAGHLVYDTATYVHFEDYLCTYVHFFGHLSSNATVTDNFHENHIWLYVWCLYVYMNVFYTCIWMYIIRVYECILYVYMNVYYTCIWMYVWCLYIWCLYVCMCGTYVRMSRINTIHT